MLNTLKIVLISSISPLSAYLSQSSHQSLWSILLLSNPFTVFLLISSLTSKSIGASHRGNILVIDLKDVHDQQGSHMSKIYSPPVTKKNDNNALEDLSCCSKERDMIYCFHKYSVYSLHLTLLWITRKNLVHDMQMSCNELGLLYGSTIALICLMLKLKIHIEEVTGYLQNASLSDSISARPLTSHGENENDNDNIMMPIKNAENKMKCDQICYLKLLAHPTMARRNIRSKSTFQSHNCNDRMSSTLELDSDFANIEKEDQSIIEDDTLPVPYDHMDQLKYNGQQVDELHLVKRAARLHFHLRKNHNNAIPYSRLDTMIQLTGPTYLTICNVIHLFILLQYTYYNLTFSCASKPSRFGLLLLMPYDCSAVFDTDNRQGRLSMFAALTSAQTLVCQLVMLAFNAKILQQV